MYNRIKLGLFIKTTMIEAYAAFPPPSKCTGSATSTPSACACSVLLSFSPVAETSVSPTVSYSFGIGASLCLSTHVLKCQTVFLS